MSALQQRLAHIDRLKAEVDALRPIDVEQERRIVQKIRLDWNYNSNAIEGNTLTQGETRALLMHGLTAKGKPLRDHLDIRGHDQALDALQEVVRRQEPLTEALIREFHKVLLGEPYEVPAKTPEGRNTTRTITPGRYKTMPNSVETARSTCFPRKFPNGGCESCDGAVDAN